MPRFRFRCTFRWNLCVALLLAAGWFVATQALGHGDRQSQPVRSDVRLCSPDQAGPQLAVAPVTFRPVRRTIEAVGTLRGYEEVSICATAEGRVVRLEHDVADHVRPGDVLLQVEPIDYVLAVRQAEKALLVELAKLGLQSPPAANFDVAGLPTVVEAKVKADNCRSHFDRAKVLFVHKAVTEEELLDKQVEYRMAEAEYENQISLAKAELATIQVKQEALAIAQQRLADTVVKAPAPAEAMPNARGAVYAVEQRCVTAGSYVHPGAEVYRLVIDNTLKLQVPVPDSHASEIRDGQSVQVSVAGLPQSIAGEVTRINPTVDPDRRTFDVEVRVPNADGLLKVGGIATATILTHVDRDAATVPSDAPLTSNGVTKLLLAEGEHIQPVAVTLGAKNTDWVEVLHPALPRGTRVVVNGQLALMSRARR